MRKELIDFLAALFVADTKTSCFAEAAFFGPPGWFGNSTNSLINMFREFGVLWPENYEDVTAYWIEHYKSDRPNMYIRPRAYNPTSRTGKIKLQICREALQFLEQETKPLSEGRLPLGIEQAICRLLALAKVHGHEIEGLGVINNELRKDRIQLVKSLSGDYEFEYGIITDRDNSLLLEAEMSLRKLEKGLRELIQQVFSHAYPKEWQQKLGLSEDRLERIRHRMEENTTSNLTGQEHPLLEYSDFYDLITIVKKGWTHFQPCLKDKAETVLFLEVLHPFRNDFAHRRQPSREDLMLVIGIASRLCERVTKGLLSTG